MKKSTLNLESLIQQARKALLGVQGVTFAYLFGSLAGGSNTVMSDIDIAVYLDEACDPTHEKMKLLGILMDHLGTDDIDLVVLNTSPLTVKVRVLRKKRILIDRKPFARHSFESLVMREYFDFSRIEESILTRRFNLGG